MAALALLAAASAGQAGAEGDDAGVDVPVIVAVRAPTRLPVGIAGNVQLTYRAPQANVVAVVEIIEDLDPSGIRRATRQREFNVIARAFGRETGELTVPLAFDRPGRKRVVVTLVTDERDESEPAEVEVEATLGGSGSPE